MFILQLDWPADSCANLGETVYPEPINIIIITIIITTNKYLQLLTLSRAKYQSYNVG